MCDVLVMNHKTFQNEVVRNKISKKEAKKLVNQLREQGFKAQLVTSKGSKTESEIFVQEPIED